MDDPKLTAIYEEAKRREEAGVGCGSCEYCELGAAELCRHYDLALAKLDIEPTTQPPEDGEKL